MNLTNNYQNILHLVIVLFYVLDPSLTNVINHREFNTVLNIWIILTNCKLNKPATLYFCLSLYVVYEHSEKQNQFPAEPSGQVLHGRIFNYNSNMLCLENIVFERFAYSLYYLTNRLHFPVVCSVIDTHYDVICGKNKKVTSYDVTLCIYKWTGKM